MRDSIDLAGQTFGRLSVIDKVYINKNRGDHWKCKCTCGEEKIIYGASLRKTNPTQSCGCLQKEGVARARKNDLTNKKFGRLTAIKATNKRHHGRIVWLCKCECGNYHEVPSVSLVTGSTRSCGCLVRERVALLRKNDLTNKKFGRLTAIKTTDKRYHGSVVWLCKCECGNYHEVPSINLVTGSTKSCGCLLNNNDHHR